MYEYDLCVYVCVHVCVSGSVCMFTWEWECVHAMCQRSIAGVGPHLPPCLRWSLLSFALLHTRVAGLQASGGSVSPSAVRALGLQMHDICYCIQLYRGVLCSECSYTYPAPSSPTLWPHPCVRKESRGAQSHHAQHTTSDLSPGNCVTNRV